MSERDIKIAIWVGVIIILALLFIFRRKIFTVLLTSQQEYYIKDLHPKVQNEFRRFVRRVEKDTGYKIIFTSGYRTFAEQQKEYEADSSNAAPGYSFHEFGMASDINATNGTDYLRKGSSKEAWEKSGIPQIAREMGFRWGGDFASYYDPVHFDRGNDYDVNTLRELAINQFGSNWNDIEGNKIKLT